MPEKVGVLFNRLDKLAAYERAVRAVGLGFWPRDSVLPLADARGSESFPSRDREGAEPAVKALDPIRISPEDPKPLDGLGGLLFTGGSDTDPAMYGEDRLPQTRPPVRDRGEPEADRRREALDRDLPVFAICRGVQLLNVVRGGALIQHLPNTREHPIPESGARPAHAIDVVEGSRLAAILGGLRHEVNSRHHQAAGRLGANLTVTARAGEVVEALEGPPKTFVPGVQWRPESSIGNPVEMRLFEAFRDAVNSR